MTWEAWLSLGRGRGLYPCFALFYIDGSFWRLILCMYIIMNAKDASMMTLHVNDTIWWLILLWTCNWSMLLKVWCFISFKGYVMWSWILAMILGESLDWVRLWGFAWLFHFLALWEFMGSSLALLWYDELLSMLLMKLIDGRVILDYGLTYVYKYVIWFDLMNMPSWVVCFPWWCIRLFNE